MHNIHSLRVFQQARSNIQSLARIAVPFFGDLHNQMQRAAISVVSNIAEGAASASNKQFVRYLSMARASNNELLAQLIVLEDLGHANKQLQSNVESAGKMLTNLIKYHRKKQK